MESGSHQKSRSIKQAIKLGNIKVRCYTVVLYLEGLHSWQDVPPIKNALQTLCRVIRSYGPDPRIFIANHLPRVSGSPLKTPMVNFNFTLQQAVRSVCRALGRVFELSIWEHFTSKKGKAIKPTHRYLDSQMLAPLGCLVFRECLLREVGLRQYWFDPEKHEIWSGHHDRGTSHK